MDSNFFRIYATINIVVLFVLWVFVSAKTIIGIVRNRLLIAPCLIPKNSSKL